MFWSWIVFRCVLYIGLFGVVNGSLLIIIMFSVLLIMFMFLWKLVEFSSMLLFDLWKCCSSVVCGVLFCMNNGYGLLCSVLVVLCNVWCEVNNRNVLFCDVCSIG